MGGAKKSRTVTRQGGSGAGAASAAGAPQETKRSWLSSPHLSMLLCLSVWAGYVVEYRTASMEKGGAATAADPSSSFCSKHFDGRSGEDDGCTEAELFFIWCKYYSSALSTCLVAAFALLCWTNEPLLKRLSQFLLVSPLGGILLSVVHTPDGMNPDQRIRMSTMSFVLSAVVIMFNRVGKAPPRPIHIFSASNAMLAALIVFGATCITDHFIRGPEGFTTMDPPDVTTPSTELLFSFVAVDLATRALLAAFALFFLDRNRKSVALIYLAVANFFHYSTFNPDADERLRGNELTRQCLLGSAVLSVMSVFIPEFQPTHTAKSL